MLSFDTRDPYDDLPSKLELQSAIDGIPATDLSALPTKAELQSAIDGIPATDLSGLPTKLELQSAINGIPATDLSDLPTHAELQSAIDGIPATDLSDLPTKAELQSAIDGIPATDLSDLPTKAELQTAIDGIPATDLSAIATRADVVQQTDGLSRTLLAQPTTVKLKQELAKQYTATQQAFDLISFGLSTLPTKAELQTATDLSVIETRFDVLPTKGELFNAFTFIPSKHELQWAIDGIPATDLSGLSTKADLQSAVGNLPTTAELTAVKDSINSWTTTMFTQPYTGESFPGSLIQTIGLNPTIHSQVTRCENKLDRLLQEVESLAARI